ncbi:MAG TPA: hypothetical protein GXX58_08015 [Gelria sp.]|jgi:hypothetical protein|nr:hypothetical protein [Gelria sp.]
MTNFLPAGIIKDTITDIHQKSLELKKERNLIRLQQGITEIEDMALDLAIFLEKLSCEPLIYTGPGTTEEVIKRLDWALTFGEEIDPAEFLKYNREKKRNNK